MDSITLFKKVLASNLSAKEFSWLENIILTGQKNEQILQTAFAATFKHVEKKVIHLDKETREQFQNIVGFLPERWTSHKFVRTFIILNFKPEGEEKYIRSLNTLFEAADTNELVTLYTSVSLFHYPQKWLPHAKEAVRSSIGNVFDAIAFNNPYPFKYFDEAAWNQMILKTIFNEKDIKGIYGLKQRLNKELAYMISDFAQERWAAKRSISPDVWELVSPFMDQRLMNNIKTLFLAENNEAATHSGFEPAKILLKQYNNYSIGEKA